MMSSFVWQGSAPVALESATVGPSLTGHFAGRAGDWWVRDPMGVQKLFFAVADGAVVARRHAIDLVREGFALERIWSVPSGRAMRLGEGELEMRSYAPVVEPTEVGDWRAHVEPISRALTTTFQRLSVALAGRRVFVTLSGGLDSSGIAALAQEHLEHVTAVTFHVAEDGESDDLRSARVVAEALGLPFEVVTVEREALLAGVDDAIVDGQDYRDFNLHCALVNQALAAAIADLADDGVVLTGDGMNELLCDYSPVEYAGEVFYPLPDLPPAELRRVLVRGLDAGDREVGVFARRGLDTVQPYLLCASEYLALPAELLTVPGGKAELARAIFGERIPESVYARPKVRAQVASDGAPKGTLAALADRGLTGDQLAERAARLYGCSLATLRGWIRGGMYRFPTRWSQVADDGRDGK